MTVLLQNKIDQQSASECSVSAIKPGKIDYESDIKSLVNNAVNLLKKTGQSDKAFVIDKVYSDPGNLAVKIKKVIEEKPLKENLLSDIEATAYLLNNSLTVAQYNNTKFISDSKHASFLPPYGHIQECKKELEPNNITVSEKEASVGS